MHRPLWQIFLCLFLVAFVLQRGAAGFLVGAGAISPVLTAGYALQMALGVATALGLWLARRWTIGAALGLGVCVAATALLEGFFLGVRPPLAAVSQVLVAALASGGLALILRHELGGAGTARGPEGADPTLRASPGAVIAGVLLALLAALWLGWGFRYPPTAAVVGDEAEREEPLPRSPLDKQRD